MAQKEDCRKTNKVLAKMPSCDAADQGSPQQQDGADKRKWTFQEIPVPDLPEGMSVAYNYKTGHASSSYSRTSLELAGTL